MSAAPVTAEQLQLAWRQVRFQPGWPPTLEAALANHTKAICLQGIARNLGRASVCAQPQRPGPATAPAAPPVPATPSSKPSTTHRQRPARFDFDARRAAANDFDTP